MEFTDNEGEIIARMDVLVNLFFAGPTIINEFILNSGHQKQTSSVKNWRIHLEAPDCKYPDGEKDDKSEWNIICAEFDNGQKIAIKYKKSHYELIPVEEHEKFSQPDKAEMTKSKEKLNTRVFELMKEMHTTITETLK